MISSAALYNAAKHKGLRGLAHPTYGTSFETFLGRTSENAYSRNSQKHALNHLSQKRSFLEQYLNVGYAPKYLVTEFSEVRIQGILGSWSTLRTGSTPRCSGSGLTNNRGAIRLQQVAVTLTRAGRHAYASG